MQKQHKIICVTLFAALMISCSSSKIIDTITIEGGQVQGIVSESPDVLLFKGIPYAAPPVGDLRWALPQPVIPWEGVKVCDTWGSPAVQPGRREGTFYYKEFQPEPLPPTSEDCLYLNVWAPAKAVGHPEAKLPVALWFHGGANSNGYGYDVAFVTDEYAKRGVILITINYRLGTLGFFSNPELAKENPHGENGSQGIYDQLESIKWTRKNIAQFGGDPDNITIFGQSAGAMDTKTLICSPLTKGLVAKAIIQSGGGLTTNTGAPEGGQRPAGQRPAGGQGGQRPAGGQGFGQGDRGGAPAAAPAEPKTLAELRQLPVDRINEAGRGNGLGTSTDGYLIVENFDQAVTSNHVLDIPYIIGSNGDDMGQLKGGTKEFGMSRDSFGGKPTYVYYFDRKLPGDDQGAFHSAELWYTFKTLGKCWRPMEQHDYDLSEKMITCWTNFMKYGNPNGDGVDGEWKPCTQADPYVQLFK